MPLSSTLLQQYPNPVFIETGAYLGDGIQAALDAGFEEIISIELAPKYVAHCRKRFQGNPRVQIVEGDSGHILDQVIRPIDRSITFWLDGHYSGGDTAKGTWVAPLLQELTFIRQHPIKTHTLLIDDLRVWRDPAYGHQFSIEELYTYIRQISPAYQFTLADGHIPDDILVAYTRI